MQLEFTPESLDELNYERYHPPLPMVQRRMEALWLKSHGLPHGQIYCPRGGIAVFETQGKSCGKVRA